MTEMLRTKLKIWSAAGVAVVATAGMAQAGLLQTRAIVPHSQAILIDADNGAGGEGGGEGGGSNITYALGSTDENAFKYETAPQLEAYSNLVLSSYTDLVEQTLKLQAAVDALLAQPSDESLNAARQAWIAARPAYLKTEAFRFYGGPIDGVESELNSWPMNEAYIDYVEGKPDSGLINDPQSKLDVSGLEGLNQKQDEKDVTIGWHAIEFLLWGQDLSVDGPGNRPYTDYLSSTGNNDRRRSYLKLVTDQLAKEMQGLQQQWQPDDPKNYVASFKALPPREAIGRMVNGMAILAGYEFMSERLAVALDSGDQEDEHSCFSDNTKNDFVFDLVGIKQVWTGDSGDKKRAGLDELVRAQDPVLADKLEQLIADAETKIAGLGSPWDQVLAKPQGSPERMAAEAVVTALQALGSGFVSVGKKLGVLVLIPASSG